IRKKAGYIAALDYLLHQGFAKDDSVTQKGLAETYGVSSTTSSAHFHKFVAEMEASNEEKVYIDRKLITTLSKMIESVVFMLKFKIMIVSFVKILYNDTYTKK